MIRRLYIVGQEALDVARLTGLSVFSLLERRSWRSIPLHPNAVTAELRDLVYIDLTRLDWADRWRVAWARIGAHQFLRAQPKEDTCPFWQSSVVSSSGSPPWPSDRVEVASDPLHRRGGRARRVEGCALP